MSFHKHVIASATDVSGGNADFDFERFFNPFPQFEAMFNHSESLFSHACSIVEDAEGWGVSEWQVAASWTVTGMVNGVDDNSFVNKENHFHRCKIPQLNGYAYKFGMPLQHRFT